MESFMFTVSIDANNRLLKTNCAIESPTFRTTYNGTTFAWKMAFYTKNERKPDRLIMHLLGHGYCLKPIIGTKFQFGLITNKKSDMDFREVECKKGDPDSWQYVEYAQFYLNERFDFSEKIPEEVKIYSDNCFKILCKIYIPHKSFELEHSSPATVEQPVAIERLYSICEHFVLPTNLSYMFDQAIGNHFPDGLCDVILVSSDAINFRCNKFVLAASSNVFKTMFASWPSNEPIPINDIDGKTLMEVLRFIYKKEFSQNLNDILAQALYAAEKYDLDELKLKCIATLKFHLNPDNVLKFLDLAVMYSSDSLKSGCFEILRVLAHMIDQAELNIFMEKSNHESIRREMHYYRGRRFDNNFVV